VVARRFPLLGSFAVRYWRQQSYDQQLVKKIQMPLQNSRGDIQREVGRGFAQAASAIGLPENG
jgi:hypothetical protein